MWGVQALELGWLLDLSSRQSCEKCPLNSALPNTGKSRQEPASEVAVREPGWFTGGKERALGNLVLPSFLFSVLRSV